MTEIVDAGLLESLGIGVGLIFSIMLFSAILGDHALARLGQYLLVGISFGYLGVLAIRHALWPHLVMPLIDGTVTLSETLSIGLCLLLLAAGLEQILQQQTPGNPLQRWRLGARFGMIPVGVIMGVAIMTTLLGVVQGTIAPQFLYIVDRQLDQNAPLLQLLTGLTAVVLSIGALLHFVIDPERHLISQSLLLQRFVLAWMWIGERGVWFAAGVIFVRIFAARLSLLIALIDYWLNTLQQILRI
jgi:hypothetical protein